MEIIRKVTIGALAIGVGYLAYRLYQERNRIKSRRSGIGQNGIPNQYPSLQNDWQNNTLGIGNITKGTTTTTTTALTEKQRCEKNFGIWRINARGEFYCDRSSTKMPIETLGEGGGGRDVPDPNKTQTIGTYNSLEEVSTSLETTYAGYSSVNNRFYL